MPIFIAALMGALINVAATLAGRVLIALGFVAVTFTGLNTSLSWLKDQAVSNIQSLPAEAVGMLVTLKVGESISIIVSALLARMLLDGLSSGGSISKLVKR